MVLLKPPKFTNVFIYDIAMDQVWLHRYCPSARFSKKARMTNHKLVFNKWHSGLNTGLPSLIRTNIETDSVWGIVFEIIPEELPNLERKLIVPERYHPIDTKFKDRGNNRYHGITYKISDPDEVETYPSKEYKQQWIEAVEYWQLPEDWIEFVKNYKTID